jgi:hypothetical protein
MQKIKKIIKLIIFLLFIAFTGSYLPALANNNSNINVPAVPVLYTVSVYDQNYTLQAFKINGHDYFKLRDIAFILKETIIRFDVRWDIRKSAIYIKSGYEYHKTGGELIISDTEQTAVPVSSKIYFNDKISDYFAYFINGNTYMKITDIAEGVGFQADIDTESPKVIIKSIPIEPNSYAVTLIADCNTAYFNGIPITLSAQPFIKNDIFYIPLEPVTKLLGGTYSFENNVATIELFGDTYKYQIGSRSIIVNGEIYTISGSKALFKFPEKYKPVDDNYVPVIINNTVYIPSQFMVEYECPFSILAGIYEYPQSRSIILGNFWNNDERGIREVKLEDIYNDLPDYFRAKLNYEGVVGEVLTYNIEKYANYDLEVYVMRLKEPSSEDIEHMDGRVCTIKINHNYRTLRGLSPAESAYRAWLLYGYHDPAYSISYKVKGGYVDTIIFYTRYYGSQL